MWLAESSCSWPDQFENSGLKPSFQLDIDTLGCSPYSLRVRARLMRWLPHNKKVSSLINKHIGYVLYLWLDSQNQSAHQWLKRKVLAWMFSLQLKYYCENILPIPSGSLRLNYYYENILPISSGSTSSQCSVN